MKNLRIESVILAIGLVLTGYFVKAGLNSVASRDRVVNVKGLAEMEVPADKVTWPLMYKNLGNDSGRCDIRVYSYAVSGSSDFAVES